MGLAVVDAGPLLAAADRASSSHAASVQTLSRRDLQLVVPAMAVAEATYFIGGRLGARAEAAFLRGLQVLEVEAPTHDDLIRMGELVEQYTDFPLGGTDASVVALAERLDAQVVVTLDRRHFAVIKPRHCDAFELLP